MKKQLLLIIALLVSTGLAFGITIDFAKTNNFTNVPATGLKVGETFTITNIDPKVFSPGELKDAAGNVWAKKTGVVYPYGGGTVPRLGTATFTVKAIPQAAAPIVKPPVPERPSKLPPQPEEVEPIKPPVPPRKEEPIKPKPTPEMPGKPIGKPTELPEPMPEIKPPAPKPAMSGEEARRIIGDFERAIDMSDVGGAQAAINKLKTGGYYDSNKINEMQNTLDYFKQAMGTAAPAKRGLTEQEKDAIEDEFEKAIEVKDLNGAEKAVKKLKEDAQYGHLGYALEKELVKAKSAKVEKKAEEIFVPKPVPQQPIISPRIRPQPIPPSVQVRQPQVAKIIVPKIEKSLQDIADEEKNIRLTNELRKSSEEINKLLQDAPQEPPKEKSEKLGKAADLAAQLAQVKLKPIPKASKEVAQVAQEIKAKGSTKEVMEFARKAFGNMIKDQTAITQISIKKREESSRDLAKSLTEEAKKMAPENRQKAEDLQKTLEAKKATGIGAEMGDLKTKLADLRRAIAGED